MKFDTVVYIMYHLSLVATMGSQRFKFSLRSGYVLKREFAIEYLVDSLMSCCSLCGNSLCTALSWNVDTGSCMQTNVKGYPNISEEFFEEAWNGWTSYDLLPTVVQIPNQGLNDDEVCQPLGLTKACEEDVRKAWRRGFHGCKCGIVSNGDLFIVSQKPDFSCFPFLGTGVRKCDTVLGLFNINVWCTSNTECR